jgi:hypothetical protein
MKARFKRVFGKGRYANVTATMALIVALGGTSYAAISLPKNSVGTRQIKRGAVRNSDIGRNAVTSGKVRNGSLRSEDFRAGQLPAGPQGVQGARGPSDGFSVRTGDVLLFRARTDQTVASLRLPAGKFVITAKLVANNNDAAADHNYGCSLLLGGREIDDFFDDLELDLGRDDNNDRDVATLTSAGTLAADGTADLVCTTTSNSGNWLARTITAIQVERLNGA